MKPLILLGATGSIGRQTLEVAERLGIRIAGLAVGRPRPEVVALAQRFPDAAVSVAGGSSEERRAMRDALGSRVEFGADSVVALASTTGATVMNGIVGSAGLVATIAALEAGNRLCLANKESLVAAGDLVRSTLDAGSGTLIPVDSEHSALHQLVAASPRSQIDTLVLTASGGPFRGRTGQDLEEVSVDAALAHPTWSMGGRITIDSATLVNKGLEVIEAHVLFGIGFDRIEVVVHPQSLVHALVRLSDGALFAHVGHADMRVPIQYALTYPERVDSALPRFDIPGTTLTFEAPDLDTFPGLRLAYQAGRVGGSLPAVFNAADEVAVAAFFQERLGFNGIARVIEATMEQTSPVPVESVEHVLEVDAQARSLAASLIAGAC